MVLGSVVRILSPQGEMTPVGMRVTEHRFRVVGIFESGFFELDALWAFTSIRIRTGCDERGRRHQLDGTACSRHL